MKYEIIFEKMATVTVEAESKKEAEEKAACMEDEIIEKGEDLHGWMVWDIKEQKESQLATSQEKKGDKEDV